MTETSLPALMFVSGARVMGCLVPNTAVGPAAVEFRLANDACCVSPSGARVLTFRFLEMPDRDANLARLGETALQGVSSSKH